MVEVAHSDLANVTLLLQGFELVVVSVTGGDVLGVVGFEVVDAGPVAEHHVHIATEVLEHRVQWHSRHHFHDYFVLLALDVWEQFAQVSLVRKDPRGVKVRVAEGEGSLDQILVV